MEKYILIFIISVIVGNILGIYLYNKYKKYNAKKSNKRFEDYLDYCEENNICPPGVSYSEWRLSRSE